MPGYKGHISGSAVAGGIAVGAAILLDYHFQITPQHIGGLVGFCLLGGLFPDVDTDSKGQNLFYGLLILVDGVLIYYRQYIWAAWVGLFAMLPALGHHRSWTHTWWAMIIVGAPIVVIPVMILGKASFMAYLPFYAAFTVGYFSHLLLDRKFL